MKYGLDNEILRKLEEISKKYKKYKFVLFGSRARGDYKETSDIDIAIFENLSREDKYKIADEFDTINMIYKIDLVFITEKTNKDLLNSIREDGVEL